MGVAAILLLNGCLLILIWWLVANVVFLRSSQIRERCYPYTSEDSRLSNLMMWSHYWRTAYLFFLLIECIMLFILRRPWSPAKKFHQCSNVTVSLIVISLTAAIKFVFEYFRCEALFNMITPKKKFNILKSLVLLYGVFANLSLIIIMIAIQFLFKNGLTKDGECTLLYSGKELVVQKVMYAVPVYIFTNEMSILYLFVYPLWFMYQDCRKEFLIPCNDLNMLRNLAIRAIVLSVPTPLFQLIFFIGKMYYKVPWEKDQVLAVFILTGFIQYISMCLKYEYWIYIFWPCRAINTKSKVEELGDEYDLLSTESTQTSVSDEAANYHTYINNHSLQERYSEAFLIHQHLCKQRAITEDLPPTDIPVGTSNVPNSLPQDLQYQIPDSLPFSLPQVLFTPTQNSFLHTHTRDSRFATIDSDPNTLPSSGYSPTIEHSNNRERLCAIHIRNSTYLRKLVVSESSRPITSSMAMTDSRHIQRFSYIPPKDLLTAWAVERRGVTFKWFINWARWNMLDLRLSGLRKVRTRDLIERVVEIRTQKSNSMPLWLQIPEEEIGRPDFFVSHAWDMELQDLIESLREWKQDLFDNRCCACSWLRKQLNCLHEPILWFDFLALPQGGIDASSAQNTACEDIKTALITTIAAIGRVVLCTDLNFMPLQRSWCLYELAMAKQLGVSYYVARCSEFDNVSLLEAATRAEFVDVAKAKTGNPDDKCMIDKLILDEFKDFEELNKIIRKIFSPKIDVWQAGIAGISKLPDVNKLSLANVRNFNKQ